MVQSNESCFSSAHTPEITQVQCSSVKYKIMMTTEVFNTWLKNNLVKCGQELFFFLNFIIAKGKREK